MKNFLRIFFLLTFTTVVYCQDGNRIIKEVQNKFESITNLSADFSQSNELPDVKKPVTYKGKFLFEKENKYRIELKNSQIITDGKTVWNYNKKAKKVIVGDAESDQSVFSVKNVVFDYPSQSKISYVGKELIDGDSCNVIQLDPVDKDKKFESAKLWIDSNNLIKKFEIKNPDNSIMVFELSDIKINQKISKDKFIFNPPQGTEIIDLR
jgi:chaperone LolA